MEEYERLLHSVEKGEGMVYAAMQDTCAFRLKSPERVVKLIEQGREEGGGERSRSSNGKEDDEAQGEEKEDNLDDDDEDEGDEDEGEEDTARSPRKDVAQQTQQNAAKRKHNDQDTDSSEDIPLAVLRRKARRKYSSNTPLADQQQPSPQHPPPAPQHSTNNTDARVLAHGYRPAPIVVNDDIREQHGLICMLYDYWPHGEHYALPDDDDPDL
jgi:hypothetical protein